MSGAALFLVLLIPVNHHGIIFQHLPPLCLVRTLHIHDQRRRSLNSSCRALGHLLVLLSGAWYLKAWLTFQSGNYAWWYKSKSHLNRSLVENADCGISELFWDNFQLCYRLLVRMLAT